MARRLQRWAIHFGGTLGLTIAGVLFSGCGGATSGGEQPSPTLVGCPTQGVVGQVVTLTISFSEGTIAEVSAISMVLVEEVDIARVDASTFTALVTPASTGESQIEFCVLAGNHTELSCEFPVLADLGACCESIECEETDSRECFFRDGAYQGAGTDCGDRNSNPCVGACCNSGECSDGFVDTECTEAGGEYQGGASLCGDTTCPEVTGACCVGDGTCMENSTKDDCESPAEGAGGRFLGGGTDCMFSPCAESDGACCVGDGRCLDDSTEALCEAMDPEVGSTWTAGVACVEFICRSFVGACCIENGGCLEITRDACIARSEALASNWQGVGRKCMGDFGSMLCDGPPAGACCRGGTCQVLRKTQCEFLEGNYLGDNFLCRTPEVAAMCSP